MDGNARPGGPFGSLFAVMSLELYCKLMAPCGAFASLPWKVVSMLSPRCDSWIRSVIDQRCGRSDWPNKTILTRSVSAIPSVASSRRCS
jgi:hypothetical protein